MASTISNEFHTLMYAVWEILEKLDIHQDIFSLNAMKFGKLIKRQKIKSKHTLNQKEIAYYTQALVEIYRNWAMYGHRDWTVKEREMTAVFTIEFKRKTGI